MYSNPHYKFINVYPYGSRIYGTATDKSDYDFIAVIESCVGEKFQIESGMINMTLYDEKAFSDAIKEHEISVLECLNIDKNLIIGKKKLYQYNLNLEILRNSISHKASNSWVKAKKKLTIEKDYNLYIAKKSLFHSLRILMFGKQLAYYGKIVDFSEANYLWKEIQSINSNNWEVFKSKYQPLYNSLKSEFKILAPKKVE